MAIRYDDDGIAKTLPDLATVARNRFGNYLRLLGEREQIRLAIRQQMEGRTHTVGNSPVGGGFTTWQTSSPKRNLISRPALGAKIKQNVLTFQRHQYPDPNLLEYFRKLIARFQRCDTTLILFEVPTSTVVRRSLPKEILLQFHDVVASVNECPSSTLFLSSERMAVELDARHYRDMAHLNLEGARKMTRALVKSIRSSIGDPKKSAAHVNTESSGNLP